MSARTLCLPQCSLGAEPLRLFLDGSGMALPCVRAYPLKYMMAANQNTTMAASDSRMRLMASVPQTGAAVRADGARQTLDPPPSASHRRNR